MTDEIIRELWRSKDQLAKQYDYDIEKLAAALRKQAQQSGRKVVNLAGEATERIQNHAH